MQRYIAIYLKQQVKLSFLCAIIAFIPTFGFSLFYDVIPNDTLLSFYPFVLALLYMGIAPLPIIRFRRLIRTQEQYYHVAFTTTNDVCLGKTLYLSDEWLIWAGSAAFYKKHIKTIDSHKDQPRTPRSYKTIVRTKDGKNYSFWCTATEVKTIKRWMRM